MNLNGKIKTEEGSKIKDGKTINWKSTKLISKVEDTYITLDLKFPNDEFLNSFLTNYDNIKNEKGLVKLNLNDYKVNNIYGNQITLFVKSYSFSEFNNIEIKKDYITNLNISGTCFYNGTSETVKKPFGAISYNYNKEKNTSNNITFSFNDENYGKQIKELHGKLVDFSKLKVSIYNGNIQLGVTSLSSFNLINLNKDKDNTTTHEVEEKEIKKQTEKQIKEKDKSYISADCPF